MWAIPTSAGTLVRHFRTALHSYRIPCLDWPIARSLQGYLNRRVIWNGRTSRDKEKEPLINTPTTQVVPDIHSSQQSIDVRTSMLRYAPKACTHNQDKRGRWLFC